jgi:hypothetical protein
MTIIVVASLLAIVVLFFILAIRPSDLPVPEPVSPFAHLDDRKAAIYENLRDAQFEFRVGKLSDLDYQQTKTTLQKELAVVMAEIDRIKASLPQPAVESKKESKKAAAAVAGHPKANVCPSCGAQFTQSLKFCGECGKPMKVRAC